MNNRPFLKWAGNKYRIVDRILELLPPGRRLIEPFVGSGAVSLNAEYSEYLLSDSNQDLIFLYQSLQEEGAEFVSYCRQYFIPENNAAERYYELRREFNSTQDLRKKAALFIYLNRHCFNGLCRYNSKHEFNTPFGRYSKPYFPERELNTFYAKASRATFVSADFSEIMEQSTPGDVVYCDPPYVPLSSTAKFTSYDAGGFGLAEQSRLARVAESLATRGITVIISNHDTEFTQREYARASVTSFSVQRFISCKGSQRVKAGEVLAVFRRSAGSTI